jgi:hypothetical protein
MWLTLGNSGTGKSALSTGLAKLLRQRQDATVASSSSSLPTLSTAITLTTSTTSLAAIAAGITLVHHYICTASHEKDRAKTKKEFFASLIEACHSHDLMRQSGRHSGGGDDDDRLQVDNLEDLFTYLSLQPPVGEKKDMMYVILIDGLDESPTITSLLTTNMHIVLHIIPPWIKSVCTSRPVTTVPIPRASHSSLIHEYVLDTSPRQRSAVAAFIHDRFPPILMSLGISDENAHGLMNALIDMSRNVFMHAQYIMKDMAAGRLSPTLGSLRAIPSDLNGYYRSWFERQWPLVNGVAPSSYAAVRVVLELIISDSPSQTVGSLLPYICMIDRSVTGINDMDDIKHAITILQPFIKLLENGCYALVHKSLLDWLLTPGVTTDDG